MDVAKRLTLEPLIAEYQLKVDTVDAAIADFQRAITAISSAQTVQGTYGDSAGRSIQVPHKEAMLRSLRISAWRTVYLGMKINELLPASDKSKFERELQDPPEFTMANLKASFGPYIADPRGTILRGLAEAFCGLDKAYKSHSNVRIGVAKLPKRVILTNVMDQWGYSFSCDRVKNLINALRLYQGRGQVTWDAIVKALDVGLDGLTFKKFQNGNLHIIFDPATCKDINKALAEYYGEVLPDVVDPEAERETSKAVSRDLQYYPTPLSAAHALVRDLYLRDGAKVLEPSCGDGRLLDAMRDLSDTATLVGYEVHPGRAEEARAKGHTVLCRNFLDVPQSPEFDYVVMNPPFYGKHYLAHIEHAIGFLKPGGSLLSVLPASAWYDHGLLPKKGKWQDLPVGSFSESGTNVPTGIFTFCRAEVQDVPLRGVA